MKTGLQTQMKAPSQPAFTPIQVGLLQRKCACDGNAGLSGQCDECQSKKLLGLQTKLTVNEPGDIYEQEADRIADQVLAAPTHSNVSGAPPRIQRLAGQPTEQTDAVPTSVDQVLASPGRPLEPAIRQDMEQRFGHDFSRVRVHSGAAAGQSARDVSAHAYTVGHNIVFGAGRFAPETHDGKRLLAHELTHTLQQSDLATAVQRKPDERKPTTRPLPEWALTTPAGVLPGDPVPGYESQKPTYTESDRSSMLAALHTRVQLNGQRLADFYRDLRMAWMDLVLELAIDGAGLSFGVQTVASIIGNLISAPLKAGPGLIVGIIADGIVNVTDEVMTAKNLEQRKKMLRDMLVAPTVADVGEKDANGRLADLLLAAVGYAYWLAAAPLYHLWKFRIPPEFPSVPASDIRFEIAAAVLRYRSGSLWTAQLEEVANPRGTYIAEFKDVGQEVLQVRIWQGKEPYLDWNLRTHPALIKSIIGHPIRGLQDLPLIVEFKGRVEENQFDPDWDLAPRVVFGRNAGGTIIVQAGNFRGLYQLHSYCHPEEKALTREDLYGPSWQPRPYEDVRKRIDALRSHYWQYATCGAAVLLQDFIDPYYLERKIPTWRETPAGR